MSSSYDPRTSRELAEKASSALGFGAEAHAAWGAFERYHSALRMRRLSVEVELLRKLVEQAQRIRYCPEVGYVEVRHVFAALGELSAGPE